MTGVSHISYEYRIYFYYSIDIYDVLFSAFSEIRDHSKFHINTDFSTSTDKCDYIIIKHITNPLKYITNEENIKKYNEYNNNYITLQNADMDDTNWKKYNFYDSLFNISKIKISSETYMIDETNEDLFKTNDILCDLIELNQEDKLKLEKVLSSVILKEHIYKHGFVIKNYFNY